MNIIGDVAGRYKTLRALLAKMPDAQPVLVGDLVDRGPNSKEVVEFAMEHCTALMGNHESMMIDAYRHTFGKYYDQGLWESNGGFATIKSYSGIDLSHDNYDAVYHTGTHLEYQNLRKKAIMSIPEAHIEWMERLPLYIKHKDIFISHAPKHKNKTIEECADLGEGFMSTRSMYTNPCDETLIWNRYNFGPLEGTELQIFGHNADKTPIWYNADNSVTTGNTYIPENKPYAVCIDTSFAKILTGLHYPSMQVYTQEYID